LLLSSELLNFDKGRKNCWESSNVSYINKNILYISNWKTISKFFGFWWILSNFEIEMITYLKYYLILYTSLSVKLTNSIWLKLCSIRYLIFGVWCPKFILTFLLPGIKILIHSSNYQVGGRSRTQYCLYVSVWFNSKVSKLSQVYFDIIWYIIN